MPANYGAGPLYIPSWVSDKDRTTTNTALADPAQREAMLRFLAALGGAQPAGVQFNEPQGPPMPDQAAMARAIAAKATPPPQQNSGGGLGGLGGLLGGAKNMVSGRGSIGDIIGMILSGRA